MQLPADFPFPGVLPPAVGHARELSRRIDYACFDFMTDGRDLFGGEITVYPADQLLLCFYEELSSGPDMLLRRCFHHLDVDEGRYDWTTDLASNVFPTPEHPMPESLRSELKRIYLPRIASLEVFLKRPLFAWK